MLRAHARLVSSMAVEDSPNVLWLFSFDRTRNLDMSLVPICFLSLVPCLRHRPHGLLEHQLKPKSKQYS